MTQFPTLFRLVWIKHKVKIVMDILLEKQIMTKFMTEDHVEVFGIFFDLVMQITHLKRLITVKN